jgi:cytochrome P450
MLWGGWWANWFPRRQGPGTIGSEDWPTHTEGRRRLQPSFAVERLAALRPSVRDAIVGEVESWRGLEQVEVTEATQRLSVAAFSAAMLRLQLDRATAEAQAARFSGELLAYLPVGSASLAVAAALRFRRLGRAAGAAIASRAWVGEALALSASGEGDSLAGILQASPLDDATRVADAHAIALAAYDTSAGALSWLCYELACDPGLRAVLAKEWRESDGGLGDLPLARRAFRETLRLYPASWFIARRAEVDEEIGGEAVPSGTTVVTSPFVVQRNPRWYVDPDRFRPERWDDSEGLPRYAYFPFGGGVRQCLGERLAWLEGELLAGAVAALLDVMPPRRRPKIVPGASLAPRRLRLVARDPANLP